MKAIGGGSLPEVFMKAILAAMLWCCNVGGNAQRAPCYECELFKQQHSDSNPYEQIRSHCTFPCDCPTKSLECPVGVHLITDGCGCCPICARQQGDQCDGTNLCDRQRGLACQYSSDTVTRGTCRALRGAPCHVGDQNATYADGASFALDCRTQCTCQNGTYGCVSLCAQEHTRPRLCRARLVQLPGRCCAEWICDSHVRLTGNDEENYGGSADSDITSVSRAACNKLSTDWSPCSTTCGIGVSLRMSNDNEACQLVNETRLCKLRPCHVESPSTVDTIDLRHHIRMSHLCRATVQSGRAERLEYENCTSLRMHRLKWCGSCGRRACCMPQYTTTIHAQFECYDSSSTSPSLVTYPVMSILKCVCPRECERQVLKDELESRSSSSSSSPPPPPSEHLPSRDPFKLSSSSADSRRRHTEFDLAAP